MQEAMVTVDWAASPVSRTGRLTVEFGQRFYTTLVDWIDWAIGQIAAGTLQPGGPLPSPNVTNLV
jgi:hypothetical protein